MFRLILTDETRPLLVPSLITRVACSALTVAAAMRAVCSPSAPLEEVYRDTALSPF